MDRHLAPAGTEAREQVRITLDGLHPSDLPAATGAVERSPGQQVDEIASVKLPMQGDRHHTRSAPVEAFVERRAPVALPITVVIPTWNEGENIGHVLERMPHVEQLVVVDAHSQDGTVDIVRRFRPDATVLLQEASGKGNATRAGLEVATAEYVLCMDADGSMDPQEIPAFLALLQNGYDMVKGSRGAVGGGSTDFTPLRRAGNRGLVGLYNMMFGTSLSDITFGYIAFRREVLPRLGLYAQGFEIEVQMVAHAELAGLRFAELPSREADRLAGESHLNTFKDGHRVLKTILRSRMTPGREWWRHVGAEPLEYDVAPTAEQVAPTITGLTVPTAAGGRGDLHRWTRSTSPMVAQEQGAGR